MFKLKLLSAILLTFLLTGCTKPNTTEPGKISSANQAIQLTPGLEGCALYDFKADLNSSRDIYIVRCTDKPVTTINEEVPSGKTTRMQTTIILDGVEYIKKDSAVNVKEDPLPQGQVN